MSTKNFTVRRRNGDYKDLDFFMLAKKGIGAMTITIATVLIIVWLAVVEDYGENDDNESWNTAAEVYNSLDVSQRAALAPLINGELNKENNWLVENKVVLPSAKLTAYFLTHYRSALLLAIITGIVMASCVVSINVYDDHCRGLYFADLSFDHYQAWILLVAMFVAWPFLLVSRVRLMMKVYPCGNKTEPS